MSTVASPARCAHPVPARPGPLTGEYRRLVRVGVRPAVAEILVRLLVADSERRAVEATIAYATARERRRKRLVSSRPKRCPRCPQVVQAGNWARHLRWHQRAQQAA